MLLAFVRDVSGKEDVGCVWLSFYRDKLCAFENICICPELTGFRESFSKVC